MAKSAIKIFQSAVLNFYAENGRHTLPWRNTKNPYRILVSEVMLQQTQVDRVVPFYKNFLKQFPTVDALADASLGDVLRAWQGLGYNRRAKMLHSAAVIVAHKYKGRVPQTYQELVALPGVGDYTAKAILTFAHNRKEIFIETNIRSVYIHHFFTKKKKISDKEILEKITETFPKRVEPRVWYAALMDYGSHLKRSNPNPSRKSKHYIAQKPFKGSDRELRGAIIRALIAKPQTLANLKKLDTQGRIEEQIIKLAKEGLVVKQKRSYSLP